MRKMLNTLFVTTEDAYLSLENENIVVHVGEEKRAQYPLLMLEGILLSPTKAQVQHSWVLAQSAVLG